MVAGFKHLEVVAWLVVKAARSQEHALIVKAGEFIKEKKLNHLEIIALCIYCYSAAIDDCKSMLQQRLKKKE